MNPSYLKKSTHGVFYFRVRIYNRAEYLGQRRQPMQWWGSKSQALEYGAEMISIDKAAIKTADYLDTLKNDIQTMG